ncbi:MAG TPA: HAMP domain-containing protein, partial [Polyangia bacterium]|nr:HAMP domain-containing protein [Polyangia bacterium]
MKLDIRTKLVLVSVGVIAVSIFVVEGVVRRQIEHEIVASVRTDLLGRLALIGRDAERLGPGATGASWDPWADDAGQYAQLRVTVVRRDGTVVGDSEVAETGLATLENHRDRPEIAAALRGENGFSIRWSDTLRRRLVYVAMPLGPAAGVASVIRVAEPLARLEDAIARFHRTLIIAAALALGVAIAMSVVAARLMSRALRDITQAARRMSAGDLNVRVRLAGTDEIGELGRSLDGLAENLSQTLATLRGERDLFGRMLESMQEGVLVLDRDLRILLINRALREMLLLGGDIVGRLPIEAIRNTDLQSVLDSAASSGTSASGEVEIVGLGTRRFM